MPYDAAGNFTRAYNWTADKLAGIKIESERMDGEFDNFAAGMNQVLLRNGSIPWGGDLKLGGNKITGLGNGTEASPAIQFLADTTTGIYLQSAGNLGLVANGVERLRISAAGVISRGGEIAVDGQAGNNRMFAARTNGLERWTWGAGGIAETGGGLGSEFKLAYYDDAGAYKDLALSINRADGNAQFWHSLAVVSTLTVGPATFCMQASTLFSYLIFDNRAPPLQAYLEYDIAGKALNYISNGVVQWSANSAGDFTVRGVFSANGMISSATGFNISGPPGTNRTYFIQTNAQFRWAFGADSVPESGANAGSNFTIFRYNDDGSYLSGVLSLNRDTGNATFHTATQIEIAGGQMALQSFNVTDSYLVFDKRPGATYAFLGYDIASKKLTYYANNTSQFNVDAGGQATFRGTIYSPALTIAGTNFTLNGDPNYCNIMFSNTAPPTQAYMQYNVQGQLLTYSSNNAIQFQSFANGDFYTNGAIFPGRGIYLRGATGGIRHTIGVSPGEAAGNVGSDLTFAVYDNAGNGYATPLIIRRSDQAVLIGSNSELISGRSSNNGYAAPHAIRLNGGQPTIAFDENGNGTKCVIGAVSGGAVPLIHFSRGNNTGLPFAFNIATGVGTCTTWTSTSDSRLKSHIQPINVGLDAIAGLNAVTYLQATTQEDAQAGIGVFGAGVIAQDLIGTVFEGLVSPPGPDGLGGETPYAMNYMGLTAFYIAAFKDARTRLNNQRTQLTNARNRIQTLEGQLADVLARLAAGGL